MKLFLAEYDCHVDDLFEYYVKDDDTWIALGPSAIDRLIELNIPYKLPEDFYAPNELYEICTRQYKNLKKITKEIDCLFNEHLCLKNEWNIKPFLFNLWQISAICDALTGRIFQLTKIFEEFKNYKIIVHKSGEDIFGGFGLGFDSKFSIWGYLLSLNGWKNEIIFYKNPYSKVKPDFKKTINNLNKKIKKKLKQFLSSDYKIENLIISRRNGLYKNRLSAFFTRYANKSKAVVIIGGTYNWKYVLNDLLDRKLILLFINNFDKNVNIDDSETDEVAFFYIWEKIQKSLILDPINYSDIIKKRIRWIFTSTMKIVNREIKLIERLRNSHDIVFALCGASAKYTTHILKSYMSSKNIPVIGWQHGANWSEDEITQRFDLEDVITNSELLTFGERNKAAYLTSEFLNCSVESIGNIALDSLSYSAIKKINRDIITITYIVSEYYCNNWYRDFFPPSSDRIYYLEQIEIIKGLLKYLSNNKNIEVNIKLHPSVETNKSEIGWLKIIEKNKKFKVEKSINTSLLYDKSDILIIDLPTTTLLEALTTNLPVFVLTSVISPPRKDLHILSERAVCSNNGSGLIEELEKFINSGNYNASVKSREFLKLYGTYKDDGKTKERVLQYLDKKISITNNGGVDL